ncbi:hypothetical protein M408DRAFT_260798 [Serendipita vermifera MAFF 305830]|uniref:Uncharacterized protein n=1 Tax=Serendipita vermifera MAFF 305830 TaxID=933852 RepID=A0A0C2XRD7_SERVB|nr:hypothetical protein M408DRAFT_260798 [Serendipita vermifera MAFF 305830]
MALCRTVRLKRRKLSNKRLEEFYPFVTKIHCVEVNVEWEIAFHGPKEVCITLGKLPQCQLPRPREFEAHGTV